MRLELRGILRAKSPDKAWRLVERACARIEPDHTSASLERGRGDAALHRFWLARELPDQAYRDACFDVLQRLCWLSEGWTVEVPHAFPDDHFNFGGLSDRTSVSGVTHVDFTVVKDRAASETR